MAAEAANRVGDSPPMAPISPPNRALALICLAVLLATSTWFSGTAAVPALRAAWDLDGTGVALLTTSVQLGFIAGTLVYALTSVGDVFNGRHVFFASACLAATANAAFAWASTGLGSALLFRALTGFFLAGVYPVGMKLVASWFASGLGSRLGLLVGALTLGTASPYLLQSFGDTSAWQLRVSFGSGAAVIGGLLILALTDGPFLRERAPLDPTILGKVFRHRPFRLAAFGYFGHMWELYAFWALAGFYLRARLSGDTTWEPRIAFVTFLVVAIGALGCVLGGWLSGRIGERRVALYSLSGSGLLCLASGFIFALPPGAVVAVLLVWGVLVVADSPQFSALAAQHAPPEYTATALTVQTGLGFLVSVGSLQLLPLAAEFVGWRWALCVLAVGPVLTVAAVARLPERASR